MKIDSKQSISYFYIGIYSVFNTVVPSKIKKVYNLLANIFFHVDAKPRLNERQLELKQMYGK